ncbi:hypothetical protein NPIL_329721 [Nephila pilipes]|uniref:C2H2-type domain-containing protein n=1 Tax=Nephila pilipes TaxID=299642 RepID=A0A8X6U3H2_NEPPI|nr:hypothetical protein NPIL_329721 [Nephila pilipes]
MEQNPVNSPAFRKNRSDPFLQWKEHFTGRRLNFVVKTLDHFETFTNLTRETSLYAVEEKLPAYYYLNRNVAVHGNEPIYQCDICLQSFTEEDFHLSHASIEFKKIFESEKCNTFLPSESEILRHNDAHIVKKLFFCGKCGKFFPHASDLYRHMRTHFGLKSFECGVCQKFFSEKGKLDQHMRIHYGVKPYDSEINFSSLVAHDKRRPSKIRRENLSSVEIARKVFSIRKS